MGSCSHSQWTLYEVWSKDLQESTDAHKQSGNLLLSNLHFAEKLFEATNFPGRSNGFEITDHFSLVEVNEILAIDHAREDLLIVRGHEPRLADNWFASDQELRLNVAFKADLSTYMKNKLVPGDIIAVLHGRYIGNPEERVTQIETNSSLFNFPVHVILFRPGSCDNIENIGDFIRSFPRLQLETFETKERSLLMVFPKSVNAERVNVMVEPVEEENMNDNVAERNLDVNEDESDSEVENSDPNNNDNSVTEGGGPYRWVKMPTFDNQRHEACNTSSDDEDFTMMSENNASETSSNQFIPPPGSSPQQNETRSDDDPRRDSQLVILDSDDNKAEEQQPTNESRRNNSPILENIGGTEENVSDSSFLSECIQTNLNLYFNDDVSSIAHDPEREILRLSPDFEMNPQNKNSRTRSVSSSSSASLSSYTPGETVPTPSVINAPVVKSPNKKYRSTHK